MRLSLHARRAMLWRATAVGVLLGGYADLARGGITVAPLCLVLGYLVLVPTVILRWR